MVVRIGLDCHEPNNLQDFGNQKDKFRSDNYTPALAIGYPVSKHETPDPDNESDHRKLPEVNKRNGEVLETVDDAKNGALRAILKKLESGRFVFDKGDLDEEQNQRAQDKQNK